MAIEVPKRTKCGVCGAAVPLHPERWSIDDVEETGGGLPDIRGEVLSQIVTCRCGHEVEALLGERSVIEAVMRWPTENGDVPMVAMVVWEGVE